MEARKDISKLQKNRSIYLKLGFIVSLSFCLYAFNYTVEDIDKNNLGEEIPLEVIIDNVPITTHEKKKVPPPPKVEVDPEIVEIDDTPEFMEPEPEPEPMKEVVATTRKVILAPRPAPVAVAPKPAPKPKIEKPAPAPAPIEVIEEEEDKEETIFVRVEKMPMFSTKCVDEKNEGLRKTCSDKALLKYIYKNIKYPAIARENGIEGMVVLNFIVEKDGTIVGAKVVRDIGGGCGEEALRVIKTMSSWVPGQQRNKKVKVQFNLPVRFSLNK